MKHLRWSKIDLSKKTKKRFKKRYPTNFRSSRTKVCEKEEKIKKSQENRTGTGKGEFCEICKNTNFIEHLQTAAFGNILLKHNDAKKQSNYKILEVTIVDIP